ncbi:MAG: DUF6273 domain-containing protein [Clostridiales Family XIII bacterium]|jgi:hypothetical protein|nr:DUF6273 domain-containing protein [Clostridiales Family XIII bacterium]
MKKRGIAKKLTALALVLVMTATTVVMSGGAAWAEKPQGSDSAKQSASAAAEIPAVGDTVYFGRYPQSLIGTTRPTTGTESVDWVRQVVILYDNFCTSAFGDPQYGATAYYKVEPIAWRVLDNQGGKLFLMAEKALDVKPYHTDDESVTWETSTIRSWLNGYSASYNTGGSSGISYTSDNFIGKAFTAGEKDAVATTTVSNPNNPTYDTSGGNDTNDKVFLLSYQEAINSSYGFNSSYSNSDAARRAQTTAFARARYAYASLDSPYFGNGWWWLRSPGYFSYHAATVNYDGSAGYNGSTVYHSRIAVKPALNLNLTSVIFTSNTSGKWTATASDTPAGGTGDDGSDIYLPFENENADSDPIVAWNDDLFSQKSTVYNHKLATASIGLSTIAYYDKDKVKNAVEGTFGFRDVELFNYDTPQDEGYPDTVAYTFANKRINIDGTPYNVIAVVVRGTKGEEWLANFNLGRGGMSHESFAKAEGHIYNRLFDYISRHSGHLEPNVPVKNKILITGHSRGAAVANLLAAHVTDAMSLSGVASKDNIYAYTFATPNVTKDESTKDSTAYNNIRNFVNAEDFVPYMPLSSSPGWGYWKYGITHVFPSKNIGNNDNAKYEFHVAVYHYLYTGENMKSYAKGYADVINNLVKILLELAPKSNDFYDKWYIESYIPKSATLTPKEYFEILARHLMGQDQAERLKKTLAGDYAKVTLFFVWNNVFNDELIRANHEPETYFAWMKAITRESEMPTNATSKYARIACPVDIEVYDSSGNLVGKVADNVVDESIDGDIAIYVEGDVKHVYMPPYGKYRIKFVGTDTGTMEYSIEDVDIASAVSTQQKEFKNIALYDGKEMSSEIADTPNTELKIVENGKVVGEIAKDGTETRYEQPQPLPPTQTVQPPAYTSAPQTAQDTIVTAPPKMKIAKLAAGKGQVKITWKKAPAAQKVAGYEIRYKEKNAKKWKVKTAKAKATSLTIKKLKKGKVYQIQIRSYKVAGSKKYYAPWSATKTSKKVK